MSASKPLHIAITGGMRQDLSEHTAPPGTLMDAKNVRLSTAGEIEARPGTTALSAASDSDVSLGDVWNGTGVMGAVPGGFIVGSEGFAYRYDLDQSRLHTAGSYGNAEPVGILNVVAAEQRVTSSSIYSPYPLSQAVANGYVATIYSSGNGQDGYGPIASPADQVGKCDLHVFTESGTLVTTSSYSGTTTTAAFLCKDGSNSTDMVLVRQDATTGLAADIITTSATGATIATAVSVGTLTAAAAFWAICTHPSLGWLLAYQSGAGTMSVKYFSGTTQQGATITFAVTGTAPVSIYSDGTNVYVGWREGAGPSQSTYRVYDSTLTVVTGATNITGATGAADEAGPPLFGPHRTAGTAMYVVTTALSSKVTSDATIMRYGEATALGAVTQIGVQYQCIASSAPFGYGYIWVRAAGTAMTGAGALTATYARCMLLDVMAMRSSAASNRTSWSPVIALTRDLFLGAPGSSYESGWYRQHLATPQQLSDGSWVMGIPRQVRGELTLGLTIAEWLRFTLGGTRQTARYGDDLLTSGSLALSELNTGTRFYTAGGAASLLPAPQMGGVDLGFPVPPAIATATAGAGGSLTNGLYQARVVLERIDRDGRRWRSAPSPITGVTLSGNTSIAFTAIANVGWLRANLGGSMSSSFVMHFYVTTAGGATFFRATPPQGAPTNVSSGLYSFTLLSVAENEILYTDGGVLNNDFPPSCRFVRATEDRVWLAGLWETEQLQSSKIIVPGEPPQFSDLPAFRCVLPEPCTGIAYQDGTLIAFTRVGIYAIQGAGPNDQGQGAWDTPRNVTRSSGCVNALSIVETSVGVFYQSVRGIEIIPRGLGEPQFVGMAVQDTLGTTTVRSASVVSTGKSRTVRFAYGATIAGSVNVLVFDLDTQAWSRDSYPMAISAICDTEDGAVLATIDPDSDSGYAFLLESDSSATDQSNTAATEIASTLTWAKVRPFGVAGYGRFQGAVGLFDAESPGYRSGNATITLSVDSPTPAESGYTFNMNTLSGASYRRVVPKSNEGTAGALSLTTTVAGWRFMGWTLELEEAGGGSRRMTETEQG